MLFRGILVLIFLGLGLPALAEEAIISYDARINVLSDGTLAVTETIQVKAEGNQIQRGILRDFPTEYRLPDGRKVSTTFDVVKVTMNGGAVNWDTERISNGTRVRIGSANTYLKPGVYTYTIRYRTERQLFFGEGFDELYWNVTGNGWAFPILEASATVLLPEGAMVGETRVFTGFQGEAGSAATITYDSERKVTFNTTGRLGPREGLTIVVTWPEGFIARPTASEKTAQLFDDNLSLIIAYIGFLMVLGYFYLAWRQVGKDPEGGPIYARYGPPTGVSPGAMSYLEKRAYRQRAFTAAIVDLAVHGCLTIREKGRKKFILTKINELTQSPEGERAIMGELFARKDEIETHHTNHTEFRAAMKAQEMVLEKNHEGINFIRNQKHFWIGAGISLVIVFISLIVKANIHIGSIFLIIGFVGFYAAVLFFLSKGKSLFRGGGLKVGKVRLVIALGFIGFNAIGTMAALVFQNSTLFILIPLALILAANILFYNLLEKPTLEGRRLLDEIEGFKKYLSVAEADRLEFHTGEITPEVFEKYLPFAIALGVENKWGKAFDSAMTKAGMEPGSYHPVWYYGQGFHSFSGSHGFAAGFGGAFSSSISSASTPPSSSGSGGGGFSGGGGGGGGGGGW